jgi:hypothetical protein
MEKEPLIQGNTLALSPPCGPPLAIAAYRLKPIIDQTFEMDNAPEAYARLAAGGQHFGKIALTVR